MIIYNEWLKEQRACKDGYEWSLKQKERELKPFIESLIKEDHWNWANWVIVRVMNKKQRVQYAIFAAEQVIEIFENKHPSDKRPRKAIEAAKACLENPCAKTAAAAAAAYAAAAYADSAAYAAAAAAASYAATAASAYAYAAAYADSAAYAYAAATSASAASAASDAYAAASATSAATSASASARNKMRLTIINYGLELVDGKK